MVTRTPLSRLKLSAYPLLISFLSYVGVTQEAFCILAIFIVLDWALGIRKPRILKANVTSKKMHTWLMSKLLVIWVPLFIWMAGQGSWWDLTWLVTGSVWIFILAELFSIIQNIHIIRTREDILEYDAVNYAISKILKLIKNLLEKKL